MAIPKSRPGIVGVSVLKLYRTSVVWSASYWQADSYSYLKSFLTAVRALKMETYRQHCFIVA